MAEPVIGKGKIPVKKEENYIPKFFIDFNQTVIKLPDEPDKSRINIKYPLLPPYAFVHIFWDDQTKELVYFVEEPQLTDIEKEVLRLVQLGLEEMINISYVRAAKANVVIQYLERSVQSILAELGARVSEETYKKIMYYIYRDSVGLNEVEPLINDYYIEDIECNGVGFPVYVVHRKYQNLRTNITFKEHQQLVNFVEKMAQKAGKYVSYAKPMLDGALPDGSRVNATYTDDVTTRGPTFTIRKFTKDPWTPIHLISFNTASAEAFAFYWIATEHKFNQIIVGETASGKTTFLNAVLNFIPPESRIVSIEDTREINIMHENWLPSVTRTGFGMPNILGKQYGEVTLFDLLRETFRQNPDYVVLGETRGKEAYVLFQGMASGHPSYSTFHAASVETLTRRLSTPPINLPPSLIESLDIVTIITNAKTQDKNMRLVKEVSEVIRVTESLHVETNKVFEWDASSGKLDYKNNSVVLAKISARTGIPKQALEDELKLRAAVLKKMMEKNIFNYKEVSKAINAYYRTRSSVLAEFGLKDTGIKAQSAVVKKEEKTKVEKQRQPAIKKQPKVKQQFKKSILKAKKTKKKHAKKQLRKRNKEMK